MHTGAGLSFALSLVACLPAAVTAQEPTEAVARYRELLDAGTKSALAHEWEDAIEDLSEALELFPDDFEARRWRGHAYTGAERYADALADLERAIALYDADAWSQYARAMALHHLGRYRDAIDGYTASLSLDPTFVKAYEWRGFNRSLLGDHVHAIEDLDTALARSEVDNPWVHFIRGKAYAALLDFERAETDFWAALDADPKNADVLAQLGYLQACVGRDAAAIRLLRGAVEADPTGQIEARLWLHHLLAETDEPGEAATQIEEARAVAEDPATHWPRRIAALLAGEVGPARLLPELPAAGPEDETPARTCELWTHVGRRHLRAGRRDAAVRAFARAVATDARDSWEWSWARAGLRRLLAIESGPR